MSAQEPSNPGGRWPPSLSLSLSLSPSPSPSHRRLRVTATQAFAHALRGGPGARTHLPPLGFVRNSAFCGAGSRRGRRAGSSGEEAGPGGILHENTGKRTVLLARKEEPTQAAVRGKCDGTKKKKKENYKRKRKNKGRRVQRKIEI